MEQVSQLVNSPNTGTFFLRHWGPVEQTYIGLSLKYIHPRFLQVFKNFKKVCFHSNYAQECGLNIDVHKRQILKNFAIQKKS